jgi:hypothetical protein
MNKKIESRLIDLALYILIIFGGIAIDLEQNLFGVLLIGLCSYYIGRRHQKKFVLQNNEVKK